MCCIPLDVLSVLLEQVSVQLPWKPEDKNEYCLVQDLCKEIELDTWGRVQLQDTTICNLNTAENEATLYGYVPTILSWS